MSDDFSVWNLSSYFDTFDGTAYREFRDDLKTDIAALLGDVRGAAPLTAKTAGDWATHLLTLEGVTARAGHLRSYLGCLTSADTENTLAASEEAAFSVVLAEMTKIHAQVNGALKLCNDEVFELLVGDPRLEGARYAVERSRTAAQKTMDAELEELAADLSVNAISAWGRLYNQISGRLQFDLAKPDGTVERTPMALKRSLSEHADPHIRRATLEGSNAAWESIDYIVAGALNAIAGHRLTLYKRRGIDNFLDQALFDAGITRKTLDAMMGAMASRADLPRAYLRTKARLLGKDKLGFQDLSAPLPLKDNNPVPWHVARERIIKAFSASYPGLGEFAQHAFDSDWIESEARAGKRPGGFCTGSRLTGESRIFMTYNRTLGDVQTLAHELGHAFHSWVMRDMRSMARSYPMTLAETASTFAETLFTDAILQDPASTDMEKALVLDTRLDSAAAFMLNIPMRFHFEKRFYEERADGEVSVDRIKNLMLEAQRECYGDVLNDAEMDAYFWASKLHFYITSVSFYNFPYSFGYLFSLGVYGRREAAGADFIPQYERLLRLTGSDTAEGVARQALDADIESQSFWLGAMASIEADLAQFEAVTARIGL